MALWVYKHVILKVTHAAVVWWSRIEDASMETEVRRLQKAVCIMMKGAMKTTPTLDMKMLLDLPTLSTEV